MSERDPWERRPHESAQAYAAFRAYRDLGPGRKLDDVETDVKARTLKRWRAEQGWEARCRAWAAECHHQEDQRRLEAIRSMDEFHTKTARVLVQAGLRALQRFGDDLTPHQVARFVDLGTRLERSTMLGTPPGPRVETSASPTASSVMTRSTSSAGLGRKVSAAACTARWSRGV